MFLEKIELAVHFEKWIRRYERGKTDLRLQVIDKERQMNLKGDRPKIYIFWELKKLWWHFVAFSFCFQHFSGERERKRRLSMTRND